MTHIDLLLYWTGHRHFRM